MPFPPLRSLFPRIAGGCVLLAALAGYCRQGSAEYFQYSTIATIGAMTPVPNSITNNGTDFVTIMTSAVNSTPIQFSGLASSPILPPPLGSENLVGIDGGTDIVFGQIDVLVVNATPYQVLSIPFTFDVTITDYGTDTVGVSQGSGVFSVSGVISGTIGAGRKINMSNITLNPVAPQLIGGDLYTMNLNTIVPPGPFFAGVIGAHVEIVPEPATCVLLGFGTIAVAIPAVRRRRRTSRQPRI